MNGDMGIILDISLIIYSRQIFPLSSSIAKTPSAKMTDVLASMASRTSSRLSLFTS